MLDAGGGTGGTTDASDGVDGGPTGVIGDVLAGVRWVGRYDASDPMAPKFGWAGTGFVAKVSVTGTVLSIAMNNPSKVTFQPVVDGVLVSRVVAGGNGTVLIPMASGPHTVELYRESESYGGPSQFVGVVGATLMTPPTYSGRLIETYSDQESDGFGDLGNVTFTNNCATQTPATCDALGLASAYQSYGAVVARALNADWSIVASPNIGLAKSPTIDPTYIMPNVYDDAYFLTTAPPKWKFNIQASAVIINLGAADASTGTAGPGFKDALKMFMSTIRSKYPMAWIFPVTGPLLNSAQVAEIGGYMQTAITEMGDSRIFYVDLGMEDVCNMPTGCSGYPSVAEHKRIADILAPIIKQKLGW
jgi:hypothetical protein